jgi:hypothetical protein
VQLGHPLGVLVKEVRGQDVGEQVVVPVPLPLVVERDEEEVGALERHQGRLSARPPGDGVTERAGESLEDRRLEEELANVRGLACQDLLAEIDHDVAVVPREPGDEPTHVAAPLHRQRSQLQGGDPPLGPPVQRRDVAGAEPQPHRPVEVRRRLLDGEAKVRRADLRQLTPRAHPSQ